MILLLQRDGRMSFVDMAKEIGVTEGTIRRKFNRLVSEGVLHIAAVTDPFKVGFQAPVVIGLKVDPARLDQVIRDLCALPQIRSVVACTGEFDLMAEGYFAGNPELSAFLLNELSAIQGIREIRTSLVLRMFKQTFAWGVAGFGPEDAAEDQDSVRAAAQ